MFIFLLRNHSNHLVLLEKFCRWQCVRPHKAITDNFSTNLQFSRLIKYEDIVFHILSLLNWLSLNGQPFSIQSLAERSRLSHKVHPFTLQNLPHVPHPPPKYPNPNSHYQRLSTKTFMQFSCFATAVTFEFLDSDKVRDPDVFAGTMGRSA